MSVQRVRLKSRKSLQQTNYGVLNCTFIPRARDVGTFHRCLCKICQDLLRESSFFFLMSGMACVLYVSPDRGQFCRWQRSTVKLSPCLALLFLDLNHSAWLAARQQNPPITRRAPQRLGASFTVSNIFGSRKIEIPSFILHGDKII